MVYPPDPPDEFLAAIGRASVRWNHLEQLLNLILIYMLGQDVVDDRPHAVFAHMAFPQKLDVFSALSEVLIKGGYPWLADHSPRTISALKTAQKKRNRIIHDVWGMKGGKVVRGAITARGSLKVSSIEVNLTDVDIAVESIEQAAELVEKLGQLFGKHAEQSRSKGKI
jgi:hypothetical protein